jgi:carboxyl-terminal processing protease
VELRVVDLEGRERAVTVDARALVDPSLRHVRLISEEPRIGWISVEGFSRETPGEVDRALASLEEGGPLEGLLLDLRGNLGGVLDAAVGLAGRFLPEGVVVRTRSRDEEETLSAVPSRCTHPDLPLVVLVDGSSASASEVVAGALQDHRRAVLVGSPTYGKGVVQTIRRFEPWGARAKVTTAWYTSPSGRNFERSATPGREEGLAPDLEIEVRDDAAAAVRAWLRAHQPSPEEEVLLRSWEEASGLSLLPRAPEDPVLAAALALLAGA